MHTPNPIIESFYTSQPRNAAAMALIKAALATFCINHVYDIKDAGVITISC